MFRVGSILFAMAAAIAPPHTKYKGRAIELVKLGDTLLNQLTSMLQNHLHHEAVVSISRVVDLWIRTTLSTAKVLRLLS